MISYAQNFEDVMLRRVLCHVQRGYYIDVGAQDATIDSVTRWFYDCGWSGINIDPHPDYYAQLVLERPRDINLNVAVSDTAGEAQFCFVRNSGLSSLDFVRWPEHTWNQRTPGLASAMRPPAASAQGFKGLFGN